MGPKTVHIADHRRMYRVGSLTMLSSGLSETKQMQLANHYTGISLL